MRKTSPGTMRWGTQATQHRRQQTDRAEGLTTGWPSLVATVPLSFPADWVCSGLRVTQSGIMEEPTEV